VPSALVTLNELIKNFNREGAEGAQSKEDEKLLYYKELCFLPNFPLRAPSSLQLLVFLLSFIAFSINRVLCERKVEGL
jgi:hypothetical protein